jgi:fructokinase
MSVAVLGEALIDLVAVDDGAYRPYLGGSPYNVAIGLARQGIDVHYLSPFSDDAFGDRLSACLRREGVALPIARRSLWPTSLALVTIDRAGVPSYRLYREGVADKDISFDEVVAHLPDDLQVFHTGSLAITPGELPMIRRLIELMHERGVVVSIDINIRQRASVNMLEYLQGVRSLLPLADIIKASDEDLLALQFDQTPYKDAELAFEEMGSGLLILTEGRKGAVLFGKNGVVKKRAYAIERVEDTIGAGDTFHSAFLASLLRTGQLDKSLGKLSQAAFGEAVNFACAAAAINVSRKGCSPPTKTEVEHFIASTMQSQAAGDTSV